MSDPYIGEIRMFAGNFAPSGWALCSGQLIPISQNTALFSILGTTYGGNGTTTFALPDLQGRAPMHWGQGPGLTPRDLGESSGEVNVSITSSQMAAHNHTANAVNTTGDNPSPQGEIWATSANRDRTYSSSPANTTMNSSALGAAGGNQPHNNLQPYTTVNFIIALQGIFPPRG
jgi:microcystin-dependent protein